MIRGSAVTTLWTYAHPFHIELSTSAGLCTSSKHRQVFSVVSCAKRIGTSAGAVVSPDSNSRACFCHSIAYRFLFTLLITKISEHGCFFSWLRGWGNDLPHIPTSVSSNVGELRRMASQGRGIEHRPQAAHLIQAAVFAALVALSTCMTGKDSRCYCFCEWCCLFIGTLVQEVTIVVVE